MIKVIFLGFIAICAITYVITSIFDFISNKKNSKKLISFNHEKLSSSGKEWLDRYSEKLVVADHYHITIQYEDGMGNKSTEEYKLATWRQNSTQSQRPQTITRLFSLETGEMLREYENQTKYNRIVDELNNSISRKELQKELEDHYDSIIGDADAALNAKFAELERQKEQHEKAKAKYRVAIEEEVALSSENNKMKV